MKKLLTILSLLTAGAINSNAQVMTAVLKPNAIIGEDAQIATNTQCNWANATNSNQPEIVAMKWTYTGQNCGIGTTRSLIRFSQLSGIPTTAYVTGVTLNLYGVPSSGNYGNSGHTGSPHATDNEVLIRRVTSAWNENTVTWNTMPTTTTANQITTPASTTQWNWNYTNSSPELLDMVQDMISNPTSNFGFMLQLNNENIRRGMLFASSDHPDSTLWPELIVTYELCNPHFTITTSSSSNGIYTFKSPVNQASASHGWSIFGPGGNIFPADTASVTVVFNQAGTYKVCHNLTLPETKCTACIEICTNGAVASAGNRPAPIEEQNLPAQSGQAGAITATPNPTENDWTINFSSAKQDRVRAIVIDMQNKVVFDKMIDVQQGENTLKIDGTKFASGQYVLTLPLEGSSKTVKMVKY